MPKLVIIYKNSGVPAPIGPSGKPMAGVKTEYFWDVANGIETLTIIYSSDTTVTHRLPGKK